MSVARVNDGPRPDGPRSPAPRSGAPGRPARGGPPASLRAVGPALLGYAAARLTSVATVLLWQGAVLRHRPRGLRLLGTVWDAFWYLDIARHGYAHHLPSPHHHHHDRYSNLAFFPLYPYAIRAVHTALPFLAWPSAALLVAWSASLAAAWGIFAATAVRYGRRVAALTTVLWGVLPVAIVEDAAYSESLFTALAAWCLWAVLTRRRLTAGLLALLAGLTRPTGIAVAAAVAAAGLTEAAVLLRARRPGAWRPLAAAVTAPLGWFGFIAWVGHRLHRWDGYFRVQELWGSVFDFGRQTAGDFWGLFSSPRPVPLGRVVIACVLIGYVVAWLVCLAHRQPLPFLVFGTVAMVIAFGDAAQFSSRARFLLPVFPLLVPLAAALARIRNPVSLAAVLLGATGFAALTGAYTVYVFAAPL